MIACPTRRARAPAPCTSPDELLSTMTPDDAATDSTTPNLRIRRPRTASHHSPRRSGRLASSRRPDRGRRPSRPQARAQAEAREDQRVVRLRDAVGHSAVLDRREWKVSTMQSTATPASTQIPPGSGVALAGLDPWKTGMQRNAARLRWPSPGKIAPVDDAARPAPAWLRRRRPVVT